MLFECQGKPPINTPKESQLRRSIASLRTVGRSTFASLTNTSGDYVQVLGGGVTCLLEYYDAKVGQRFRGVTGTPNIAFPDGTLLIVKENRIAMQSDEWFRTDQVADVFVSFLSQQEFPFGIQWRAAPGF